MSLSDFNSRPQSEGENILADDFDPEVQIPKPFLDSSYINKQMNKIGNSSILGSIQFESDLTYNEILVKYSQEALLQDWQEKFPIKVALSKKSSTNSMVQCTICFGVLTTPIILEPCKHSFCKNCLIEHIHYKITIGEVQMITCPGIICKTQLSDQFIKSLINKELFKKFQKFRMLKKYEKITNGKWCPKPNCENFVIKTDCSNILKCPCGQSFCYLCGNPEHPNRSCDENLDQTFKQAKSLFKIYPCPKCNANIQKNSGCNHMYCPRCHYEFCWLCRCKYNNRHYDCWNPFSCPGEQSLQREPYKCPKVLIGIRAILKISAYILCSPILLIIGAFLLIYLLIVIIIRCCT